MNLDRHITKLLGVTLAGCALLTGCEDNPSDDHQGAPLKEAINELSAEAKADLRAADSDEIVGEVHLHASAGGVLVTAEIDDAMPGDHGLHIHEKGDCSDIPGSSMGGHYAPEGNPHALPTETADRHLGDLGNVHVDEGGTGRLEIRIEGASLEEGALHNLMGKSVVLHMGADSGKAEQPAGDSGTPVACGVIEAS